MKYIILKQIKNEEVKLPVVLIDSLGEVLEFEDLQEAEKTRDLFQNTPDSGHLYEIKKIGYPLWNRPNYFFLSLDSPCMLAISQNTF